MTTNGVAISSAYHAIPSDRRPMEPGGASPAGRAGARPRRSRKRRWKRGTHATSMRMT